VRIDHRGADHRTFLRTLLERQPFDYLALASRLREVLPEKPDAPEVSDLCRRACLIAPELVPASMRPPSLARFLPVETAT
jgi:hypothetical protein